MTRPTREDLQRVLDAVDRRGGCLGLCRGDFERLGAELGFTVEHVVDCLIALSDAGVFSMGWVQ